MLFGIFSDIKGTVQKSLNDVHAPVRWNYDTPGNKEERVKEIFQRLGWDKLFAKTAWWDFFGWDRSVRMGKVKNAIREGLTEKKVLCRNVVLAGGKSLDVLKQEFPFYKMRELSSLLSESHPLRDADVSNWKTINKCAPKSCSHPKSFDAVMKFPKADIPRLCRLIELGVDPKSVKKISKKDRETLVHLSRVYGELKSARDLLPNRMQTLFSACDRSTMILFALERNMDSYQTYFEEQANASEIPPMNASAERAVFVTPPGSGFQMERKLFEGDGRFLFENRSYRIIKHADRTTTTVAPNIPALCSALHSLSGQKNESFNQVVHSLLREQAYNLVTGAWAGGIIWQIQQLTQANLGEEHALTKTHGKETWAVEIHDFGNGKVRLDYISEAKIQQKLGLYQIEGIPLGSCKTRFSYSIDSDDSGKYKISRLDVGPTRFEWDPKKHAPFTSLPDWPNLKEVYQKDIADE